MCKITAANSRVTRSLHSTAIKRPSYRRIKLTSNVAKRAQWLNTVNVKLRERIINRKGLLMIH